MEAKDLISFQIDASGKQVERVFAGLGEDGWDARLVASSMTPKEIIVHLTECYVAAQKSAMGATHEWGSYVAAESEPDELLETMRSERNKATKDILGSSNDQALKDASEFLMLHDAYHVGQIALLRIEREKGWDPYSIYG